MSQASVKVLKKGDKEGREIKGVMKETAGKNVQSKDGNEKWE